MHGDMQGNRAMVDHEDGGELKIRVILGPNIVLGPGKADLLEGVRETGSISAAGRRMAMSYKRAWDLVDAMNQAFDVPVVQTSKGGSGGGGASLTATGEQVLALYRSLQARCSDAAGEDIAALRRHLRQPDA